jgi:uncharacterized protein (DUF1778 family)
MPPNTRNPQNKALQRIEFRIPADRAERLHQAAHAQGFATISGYLRSLIERDRREQPARAAEELEAILAATLDRLAKDVRSLHTAHQALFALTDSLVRLFMTCIPEPPAEHLESAQRRAKLRYERFLVSVAQNMNQPK